MGEKDKDPLSPASKDPSEGPRGPAKGGAPGGSLDESHLGAGGDPVEGKPGKEQSR
jgi:hypothetical protein